MSIVTRETSPSTPITEPCQCDRCVADTIDAPASEWPTSPEIDGEHWTVTETAPDDDDETADDHLLNCDRLTVEEEAEFREWAAACDAREHLQGDRLTLRALVERQRDFYMGWQNAAGFMIGEHLDELVRLLWVTDAASPAEHFARIDALDRHFS